MKTNSKSCVLDAFACITGIPAQELAEAMGNDGSEYGVPTQMIVDHLLTRGFAITPIEKNPLRQNPVTGEIAPVFSVKVGVNRWKKHLTESRGVLYGNNGNGMPHAVAWDGLEKGMIGGSEDFDPFTLWKVTRIV